MKQLSSCRARLCSMSPSTGSAQAQNGIKPLADESFKVVSGAAITRRASSVGRECIRECRDMSIIS